MDMTERNDALFLLSMRLHHHGVISCKDSAKFRLSEENTNKFAFLSVRNFSKSSKKPNIFEFFRDAAYLRRMSEIVLFYVTSKFLIKIRHTILSNGAAGTIIFTKMLTY